MPLKECISCHCSFLNIHREQVLVDIWEFQYLTPHDSVLVPSIFAKYMIISISRSSRISNHALLPSEKYDNG